jgi:hypothetical protein
MRYNDKRVVKLLHVSALLGHLLGGIATKMAEKGLNM